MYKKKIEFNKIKELSMGALRGKHLMFVLCLMFSAFSLMVTTPANYILTLTEETALTVMDMFRVFLGTLISEFILFTLVASMYKIIFLETEEKKGNQATVKVCKRNFPVLYYPCCFNKNHIFIFIIFNIFHCVRCVIRLFAF